jgi:hypothetical protein
MKKPIQTRIGAVVAAILSAPPLDQLPPRLQLLVLEALAREIAVRIGRMSEQQRGKQAL